MMLPTHALVGMVLALAVAPVVPEFAGVAAVAGLAGGVFPDLDMYVGHRKTLHYPVYYSAIAGATLGIALLLPTAATVAVSLFFLSAAVHSVSDVFGGGLELRPWEATSDRAVYDHYRGQWLSPRRWVGYDGSPGDLLLAVSLAVPLLVTFEGTLRQTVVLAVAVGIAYAAVRRTLPTVAEWIGEKTVSILPDRALAYVPTRYRNEETPRTSKLHEGSIPRRCTGTDRED